MVRQSVDVLVVTALGEELEAVKQASGLKWRDFVSEEATPYSVAQLRNGVTVGAVQLPLMGPVSSAVGTTRAIEALSPKRVILTGIAAGIGPDVHLGDIVVSDQVVDYDSGKVTRKGMQRRWRAFPVDPLLLSLVKRMGTSDLHVPDRIKRGRHPESAAVHVGTVLSGSQVVADGRTISNLSSTWAQAVGLEMEGGGGASAAHNSESRPTFIIIKGVTDKADSKKDDSVREYAAYLAAAFVFDLLRRTGSGDPGELGAPPPREPWRPLDEEAELGLTVIDVKAMLKACFNLSELKDLCSDIGLDWEDLSERDVKTSVIEQIVSTCKRHAMLRRLVERMRALRPYAF